MNFIEWNSGWEIGVPVIDEQHRIFAGMINRLFESVEKCGDIREERAIAERALVGLADYARYHFETEEKLMADWGYEGLEQHIARHAGFCERIDSLAGRFREGEFLLSLDLFYLMKQWLYDHITGCDRLYVLSASGRAAAPDGADGS
ncbi:MAG: bacteriohemerythrin [Negativicutes bacterium]|nr:bacteriohemerythrin [Negativicutes bacterium]